MRVPAVAGSTVKIRVASGDKEIEIEGPRSDVDALLDRWWHDPMSPNPDGSDRRSGTDGRKSSSAKVRKTAKSQTKHKETAEPDSFDAHAFANRVKGDAQIAIFQKKIISPRADWFNKTAFVLWYADEPLTSGQIHKALTALGVKGALSRVSTALAQNMNSFITSEQRKVGVSGQYSLAPNAKTEFEKWLLKDPKADG